MLALEKWLARLINLFTVIGAIALVLMMLHISADVLSTIVFNKPLPGTIPVVSQYDMIIVSFLPLALVERQSGHISVEVVTERLRPSVQNWLAFLATALGFVMFSAFTWRTWNEAVLKFNTGTFSYEQGVKVITWPTYFFLPLGTGLLALVLLYKLVRFLRRGPLFRTNDRFACDPESADVMMGEAP